jgi:hypothetical protein
METDAAGGELPLQRILKIFFILLQFIIAATLRAKRVALTRMCSFAQIGGFSQI